MEKVREAMAANPDRSFDDVLQSEKRLAARLGLGHLIRCRTVIGNIDVKICEICVQVSSEFDLDPNTLASVLEAVASSATGEFE